MGICFYPFIFDEPVIPFSNLFTRSGDCTKTHYFSPTHSFQWLMACGLCVVVDVVVVLGSGYNKAVLSRHLRVRSVMEEQQETLEARRRGQPLSPSGVFGN